MENGPKEDVTETDAEDEDVGLSDTPTEPPLTSVPMTDVQRYRLQATEATLELRKLQACAEVDKRYAVLRAIELERTVRENLAVKAAQRESTEAINQTLVELEAQLPEGYSLTNLEWETGTAHVAEVPGARGQRLPVE